MTEQLILKQYSQLPENLKKEFLAFLEFLVFKNQNQQQGKQQKTGKKKSENEYKPAPDETPNTDLQRLLLEAPDMTEEEYSLIMEKRKALNQWK